ncbi:MAG: polyphosphate polymerase domain-containing protein [Oscillospiraceae bacterium]|nr:polyphosphate polymerase domain-containing protein [Oscillospiraceae bacterium]
MSGKFRHEYKHIISTADFYMITLRLNAAAKSDEHMKGDSYFVRSLYFDNFCDKALREKLDGVNRREKFRIRYYDFNDSFIRLEKKSKQNGLCRKESAVLTREKTERIIAGDCDFLLDEQDTLLTEFYIKLTAEQLLQKTIVDYRRKAYVFPYGNVRITFDYDISSSFDTDGFFDTKTASVPASEDIVMEIKYDEFLPQIIADITQTNGRQQISFSKYAAARII